MKAAITISGSADLTLGDYCRLLQNPKYWGNYLIWNIDRVQSSLIHLDAVRKVRNDVMHFDPGRSCAGRLHYVAPICQVLSRLG